MEMRSYIIEILMYGSLASDFEREIIEPFPDIIDTIQMESHRNQFKPSFGVFQFIDELLLGLPYMRERIYIIYIIY